MQPYIFKKQIVTLGIVTTLLLITRNFSESLFHVFLFYTFIVISVTFVPRLRKNVKYPMILHHLLYGFAFYFPLFFFDFNHSDSANVIASLIVGLFIGTTLYLSKIKELKYTYSSSNIKAKSPMEIKESAVEISANLFQLVGEEVFFRYFIINILWDDFSYFAIGISALLFVHTHFINRWANKVFTGISYVYHGILGIALGFLYITTRSLLGCILAHMIFNFSGYYVMVKRTALSFRKGNLFDDY